MNDSAVLLIDCPDRKGLVARVAGLLYEHGANILHADQHQDHELGLFFMRVEWALELADGETAPLRSGSIWRSFKAAFAPLAAELGMRWKLSVAVRGGRAWRSSARSICTAWPTCCTAGGRASSTARFR